MEKSTDLPTGPTARLTRLMKNSAITKNLKRMITPSAAKPTAIVATNGELLHAAQNLFLTHTLFCAHIFF